MVTLRYRGIWCVALVLLAGVGFGGYALAADTGVSLTSTGPQPSKVTVNLGDKLTWTNGGSVSYILESGRLEITSPAIPPGGSFEYVAIRSGTFAYRQEGPDRRSRFDGSLVVMRTGTVSLSTPQERVSFGSRALLTGTTTLPGFPVVLEHKPDRERSWVPLATLTPTSSGTFSLAVKPTVGTTYRANVLEGELLSKSLSVAVLPRVKIKSSARKVPGGKSVNLTVRVVPAAAADSVDIMRYDRGQRNWRRVATRKLSAVGVATYRWTVPYGRTLLRGWLKGRNLESGYAESHSTQILVQGTGKPSEKKRTNRMGPRPDSRPRSNAG